MNSLPAKQLWALRSQRKYVCYTILIISEKRSVFNALSNEALCFL